MATDLGKVGMVMKGNWSSSATYEVLDTVVYNNAVYIAKQAVPANTAPTNTTYWQLGVDNSALNTRVTALEGHYSAQNLNPGATVSFTVARGTYLLVTSQGGATPNFNSAYLIIMPIPSQSAGISVIDLKTVSGVTVTTSAGTITVTNNGATFAIEAALTKVTW